MKILKKIKDGIIKVVAIPFVLIASAIWNHNDKKNLK